MVNDFPPVSIICTGSAFLRRFGVRFVCVGSRVIGFGRMIFQRPGFWFLGLSRGNVDNPCRRSRLGEPNCNVTGSRLLPEHFEGRDRPLTQVELRRKTVPSCKNPDPANARTNSQTQDIPRFRAGENSSGRSLPTTPIGRMIPMVKGRKSPCANKRRTAQMPTSPKSSPQGTAIPEDAQAHRVR